MSMGKVKKILLWVVSVLAVVLIILPLTLSLLLHIPAVQDFAGRVATQKASRFLGTKVSIDKLRFRLFNRVMVEGFYVEDLQGDTLLYAGHASADIVSFGLRGDQIRFGHMMIADGEFNLRKDSLGETTLNPIIERLKNDKPKDRIFEMSSGVAILSNMTFRLQDYMPQGREFGINFSDMEINDVNLEAGAFSVVGDSVSFAINSMTGVEKSGFDIKGFDARHFAISSTGIYLDRLNVSALDQSRLHMEKLHMLYDDMGALRDFVNKVNFDAEISRSTVTFRAIAYFAPSLREWQTVLNNVSAHATGPISNMRGQVTNAESRNTRINAGFSIRGVPDIPNTHFTFDVYNLSTTAADAEFFARDVSGNDNIKLRELISKFGNVSISGRFDGLLNDFHANADVATSMGKAALDMDFSHDGRSGRFKGNVASTGFNLGRFANSASLGNASFNAHVDGGFSVDNLTLDADAKLAQLEFNGYAYNSVTMKGLIDNRTFTGNIVCEDPNILFDFDGLLDFTEELPSYDFRMSLSQANLNALNFNRRDSVSMLSCRIDAHARGSNPDNLNGQIVIDDLLYVNQVDSVRTGRIVIKGENSDESKLLTLNSAFADMEFRSRISYGRVQEYLAYVLQPYIPSLSYQKRVVEMGDSTLASDAEHFTIVRMNVKQANNVAGIFLPGLMVAEGTNLAFMLNTNTRQLSLIFKSDYIERGSFLATGIDINSRTQSDSLTLFAKSDDLFIGGFYMPEFSVIGGARNYKASIQSRFTDKEHGVSALLGLRTVLEKDSVSGLNRFRMSLTPSSLDTRNNSWRIVAHEITYDSTRIVVDGFRIFSETQSLNIDGVASRSHADTLRVRLSNFDVAPFSQFISRLGYDLTGNATGSVDFVSALSRGVVFAGLSFDRMKINDLDIAPTRFESEWDFDAQRARFLLLNRASADTVARGFYIPVDKRIRVDARLDNVSMKLLDPVLSGVAHDTEGIAVADILLSGTINNMVLNGNAHVKDMSTTVDFTNVRYTLPEAEITVKDNVISARDASVYDRFGNRAAMDMTLVNGNFRNFSYDIRLQPVNMLAMNTTEKNNELFYGNVFATGVVTVKGDKVGTHLDVVATTSPGTEFFMPLSGKEDMSELDFVVFENSARERPDTSNVLIRRKMMLERRNRAANRGEGNVDITMALNVRDNAEFQLVIDPTVGDILRGRGNGTINIHVNPSKNIFTMYGDYVISEGSYLLTLQNIINKRFIIDQGSTITWTGEPLDAMLNITAIYRLKASLAPLSYMMSSSVSESFQRTAPVDCIIKIGDRLTRPSIAFDVQVQNVSPEINSILANLLSTQEMKAQQFVWLLTINSFYTDDSGAGLNVGAMGGSATGFDFLSNQLTNWLSTDKYSFGFRYRPRSEITSDELDFGFTTEVFSDRLQLEVEGNYDFDNNQTRTQANTTSGLTGDFYLTWLINQSGTLRAKAFRRTIDRFDENQGLQESGLGIYYKQDFNTFRELIDNALYKLRRKSRRESKEASTEPDAVLKNEEEVPENGVVFGKID